MNTHSVFDIKPALITEKIKDAGSIVITTHFNPDGDAIGSCLGLYHYLAALGKKAKIIIPNAFPEFLSWLKGAERILIYEKHPVKFNKIIEAADLIFCLDYNSFSRTKFFEQQLKESRAFKILIDHHLQPDNGFDHIVSRTEVSSTAELVYEIIEAMGNENMISRELAESLFVGIMTDTGSFSFSCNYPSTFRIAACLIEKDVDAELVHQLVYDTYSEERMRLLGFCLSEKLVVLKDYATAYISIARHELEQYHYQTGDTEGVVNYALSVKDIVFAVLFVEKDDVVRVSFRSKGDFSVNDFARIHFTGGGHKNAAGADSFKSLDETITYFVGLLQDYKEELKNLIAG